MFLTDVSHLLAAAEEGATALGTIQVLALVGALALGALIMTWRRKDHRSAATTHWAVLLAAHGALAAAFHFGAGLFHLGGALVIVAMAERVIWDVSDGLAARIDRLVQRLVDLDDDDDDNEQPPAIPAYQHPANGEPNE